MACLVATPRYHLKKHVYSLLACFLVTACGGGSDDTPIGSQVSTSPALGSSPTQFPYPSMTHGFRVDQARNNQGLAFHDGYFYVGYDIGNGNGYIERYTQAGVLDPDYGRVPVKTNHTAELAYRSSDKRLYAVSGGGASPTIVYRLSADGKAVDQTYDFSKYGNSGLLAIDNTNDLLVLSSTQSGGDNGRATFRTIDWNRNNIVVNEFSLAYQGIPQGLEVIGDIIYYYTNNKITLLDKTGNILDTWKLQTAGESQGITIANEGNETYLAVGYNAPRRVYLIRPVKLGVKSPQPLNFVLVSE